MKRKTRNRKLLMMAVYLPIGENVTRRLFAVIFVVFVSLLVVFASLLSEDGVISRFMLKRDRIIVERRPESRLRCALPLLR